MSSIWRETSDGWTTVAPAGFPDEKALQTLVETTPELLPLSGAPTLTVVGREVLLGTGYADVLAVETSGRPVVIEVKLARNAEARRAVVAQVLGYAAVLYGMTPTDLESSLRQHLDARGFASLPDAARQAVQTASFDDAQFAEELEEALQTGAFRLVLVLDDAPAELVRLAGFLQATTSSLLVDIITVAHYELDGTRVLVPQRVDPERFEADRAFSPERVRRRDGHGTLVPGGEAFLEALERLPPDRQPALRRLYDWAIGLEREGLAGLSTYFGKRGEVTLLPRLRPEQAGLATVWNRNGQAFLSLWRTVFERRAPDSIEPLEAELGQVPLGKGNVITDVTDNLLRLLTSAYREAAGRRTN